MPLNSVYAFCGAKRQRIKRAFAFKHDLSFQIPMMQLFVL